MKRLLITVVILFTSLSLVAITSYRYSPPAWRNFVANKLWIVNRAVTIIDEPPRALATDSVSYASIITSISAHQAAFSAIYAAASVADQPAVLDEASDYVYSAITDSLVPFWYGTPWDFNGVTRVPQKGSIACGYFVFTILQDAGFHIPRVGLSQAASEKAIKSIAASTDIKRHSGASIEDYVQDMIAWGDGFYLVGLDYHVGILEVKDNSAWFIHSTVIYPRCVVKEAALSSPALIHSNYRISGKLSSNASLTKKWINGTYVAMD